jgi:hypothetical protein
MSNQGDMFVNQLARKLVGAGRRDRLQLTGTSGATGTDEQTQVRYLPVFTEEGKVLQLIIDGDGDLVASWESIASVVGGYRYQNLIYELDGVGGFDFITDDDGNPMYVLAGLE